MDTLNKWMLIVTISSIVLSMLPVTGLGFWVMLPGVLWSVYYFVDRMEYLVEKAGRY